jgi:hypothetical protein
MFFQLAVYTGRRMANVRENVLLAAGINAAALHRNSTGKKVNVLRVLKMVNVEREVLNNEQWRSGCPEDRFDTKISLS